MHLEAIPVVEIQGEVSLILTGAKPFEIRTFVVPQPIPVDTPVTTTSLLFAIAFLPKMDHCSSSISSAALKD
jgi:hypothetical protein